MRGEGEVAGMSEDELRQRVLDYLRKQGGAGFYQTLRALGMDAPDDLYPTWERLLQSGDIEVVQGYHPNVFLAKYQVRIQPALF